MSGFIDSFYKQMEAFASSGECFDVATMFRRYAFDVVGEVFYDRVGGFGLLRDGIDYNNWLLLMDTMPVASAADK